MGQSIYNTAAREALVSFLASNPDRQFTTDQIFESLIEISGNKNPGKSTIYRLLSKLCHEGVVQRSRDDGANYLYRYIEEDRNCEGHLHMKCLECGRVYHLECEIGDELMRHVGSEHGFEINSGLSMLYGECGDCTESKKTKRIRK